MLWTVQIKSNHYNTHSIKSQLVHFFILEYSTILWVLLKLYRQHKSNTVIVLTALFGKFDFIFKKCLDTNYVIHKKHQQNITFNVKTCQRSHPFKKMFNCIRRRHMFSMLGYYTFNLLKANSWEAKNSELSHDKSIIQYE